MAVLDGDKLVAALRGAFTRDVGRHAMLQLAADRIQAAGPPYTSVYLYMLHGEMLELEAFAGRATDHIIRMRLEFFCIGCCRKRGKPLLLGRWGNPHAGSTWTRNGRKSSVTWPPKKL